MLLAYNVAQESQNNVWFLDSGCNNHMTGNLEMFFSLGEIVKSNVTLGNDNKVEVKSKGNINILTKMHSRNIYMISTLFAV